MDRLTRFVLEVIYQTLASVCFGLAMAVTMIGQHLHNAGFLLGHYHHMHRVATSRMRRASRLALLRGRA